ncbi:MAG: cupin domain-containing protein [Candidatus Brocadiales bacterium]|nr:cupin domain-containing protein [Candidatus Brocadiales bacterium]
MKPRKLILFLLWLVLVLMSVFNSQQLYAQSNSNDDSFRRVVTGINEEGKSVIISDGVVPQNAQYSGDFGFGSDIWLEQCIPVDLTNKNDPLGDYIVTTEPPSGGVVARVVQWNPGRKYPMHVTNTIDIFIVISGQIKLILDESDTILNSGDSVIQCGTNHGWEVVGDTPCMFAAILLSADK